MDRRGERGDSVVSGMYRIRLPSGTEQIYTSIQELADAVRQGAVGRDASIFHRRSGQWLPLESHPYFAYASSEAAGTEKPPADDTAADPWATESPPASPPEDPHREVSSPKPGLPAGLAGAPPPLPPESRHEPRISTIGPMPPRPIKPDEPPPSLEPLLRPEQPSRVTPLGPVPPRSNDPPRPLAHEPIAPTPMKVEPLPASPPTEPEPRRRRGRVARDYSSAAEPLSVSPPRGRRVGMLIFMIIVLGSAVGLLIGRKLLVRDAGSGSAVPDASTSQVQVPNLSGPVPDRPLARGVDPTAPVGVEDLIDRRAAAFESARASLRTMLDEARLGRVLNVVALTTPTGALAARRDLAASLNVIGQFRRREVMIEQAYEDSARFQTERAGWTRQAIERWENRPIVREPYAAADLAESLLADADSLLAILTSAEGGWDVRGDTLVFDSSDRAAAWRAQRDRIRLQAGDPVSDPAGRPTLTPVRAAVEPTALPTAR